MAVAQGATRVGGVSTVVRGHGACRVEHVLGTHARRQLLACEARRLAIGRRRRRLTRHLVVGRRALSCRLSLVEDTRRDEVGDVRGRSLLDLCLARQPRRALLLRLLMLAEDLIQSDVRKMQSRLLLLYIVVCPAVAEREDDERPRTKNHSDYYWHIGDRRWPRKVWRWRRCANDACGAVHRCRVDGFEEELVRERGRDVEARRLAHVVVVSV